MWTRRVGLNSKGTEQGLLLTMSGTVSKLKVITRKLNEEGEEANLVCKDQKCQLLVEREIYSVHRKKYV